jgi:hypothetical protein
MFSRIGIFTLVVMVLMLLVIVVTGAYAADITTTYYVGDTTDGVNKDTITATQFTAMYKHSLVFKNSASNILSNSIIRTPGFGVVYGKAGYYQIGCINTGVIKISGLNTYMDSGETMIIYAYTNTATTVTSGKFVVTYLPALP